jgi:hypothetical protein
VPEADGLEAAIETIASVKGLLTVRSATDGRE